LTQFDTKLEEVLAPRRGEGEFRGPEGSSQPAQEAFEPEAPVAEKPDLSEVRALLTGPHPAGFGEVLVTDAWLPPPPREEGEEEGPVDRQHEWGARQELRQLGLLRERPLLTYDGRTELYWGQVREAVAEAEHAIVDPYTEFVAGFADADIDGISVHRRDAREYGRAGEALLEVGRAYLAIGRIKSAQGVLAAAAKADPLHPKIWWNLGISRLFARANGAAARALRRALDQAPGDFLTELALGVAHYHAKDYAAAEDSFRRLAGSGGLRATARSMLACSMRMQEKWDDARVELSFLRDAQPGDWAALAAQCLDCVERGEHKRAGPLRARRRAKRMWQSLATAAAGGVWIAYAVSQDLFREQSRWAALPLFLLAVILARTLRGISGGELPGEFGNAEQGLPCWQETPWMRHRKSEF